jgi:hypothetical protein
MSVGVGMRVAGGASDGDLSRFDEEGSMRVHGTVAVAGSNPLGRQVKDVLRERGRDVVSVSRSQVLEVINGAPLAGVASVIDAGGLPPEFLVTATRRGPGVERIVATATVGDDRFRAAQLRALVGQLVDWGQDGDAGVVRITRAEPGARQALAEALVDLATGAAGSDQRVRQDRKAVDADEEETLPAA